MASEKGGLMPNSNRFFEEHQDRSHGREIPTIDEWTIAIREVKAIEITQAKASSRERFARFRRNTVLTPGTITVVSSQVNQEFLIVCATTDANDVCEVVLDNNAAREFGQRLIDETSKHSN